MKPISDLYLKVSSHQKQAKKEANRFFITRN